MKARILVIDDEESIRFTFERFIRGAGHEVETAASFSEGMAKIAEKEFDLIFADIILGGETGIALLREIKKRDLPCPLVLITGYPNIETATEALRLGAFDYLPKPVQKAMLLRVARLALKHKSMVEDNTRSRLNREAILSSVNDMILMVDKDLVMAEFNEAAAGFCGFSRDLIGKPVDAVLSRCDGRCLEAFRQVIEGQKPVELFHVECRPVDNSRRVVSLTASPIFYPRGTFSGAVLVVRDETRLVDLERVRKERRQFHNIIGSSEKMQKIYSLVEDLANVQTSVLITGESGTGKELLAEAIHHSGEGKERSLVKVNCSALSESLLESELFGHVKGAFTGAVKDKIGRFQLANGGTIFLDEIGDISPSIQQRLLRVLQEREFERVGSSIPVRVDVRVIAATNKNLLDRIRRGQFREDLYYRLKVVEITLPPLRDRKEDIPLLVSHFIKRFNTKLSKAIQAVSEDVLSVFMDYSWPGNVRQLAHTLEHAFVLCHQNIITLDHLPSELSDDSIGIRNQQGPGGDRQGEIEAIFEVLEKSAGNKALAARLLGISRRTIYRRLKEHGITGNITP
jgi:PAS domain S-box-containing protein